MRIGSLITLALVAAGAAYGANPPAQPPAQPTAEMVEPPPLDKTPGDFLPKDPYPSSSLSGFYHEIPPHLEKAVRYAAEDNYSSSTALLTEELKKAKDPKERARILMWLGVTQAQEALDYDAASGWYGVATSATKHLREAIKLDPEVFKAPDVARALGQMVGSGWAPETPESEIDKSEKKAKAEKSAIDFYYAGVILQRLTQRSWQYSDTRTDDERTLGFLARSIVIEPTRYETWPIYIGSLIRLQMFDLVTSDGEKMYHHFRKLRAPLFADQGPAALYLRTRGNIPREMAEQFLNELKKEDPTDPFPHFTLAQIAMGVELDSGTTPTRSIGMFEDFLKAVEKGEIKLLPREQGYRISALYKLGYLYRQAGDPETSLKIYERIQEINPKYAETDYNIAETYLALAERETTGPAMIELLEKGREAARRQTENDYRNQAALKSDELRRRLSSMARRARAELKAREEKPAQAGN